ncbi:crotonase/enoyl-CoA hydratase family protein [Rhizobium sp. RAF36]
MTMPETLKVAIENGIARLTLARGEKHNALSSAMMDELVAASREIGADPAVRVVVLAAEGKSFCAGGDLGWMQQQFAASRAQRMEEARRLATMYRTLSDLPKPVIARVHGNSFGGGVGLLAVCDLSVAADTARFGLPEVRLGIIPATISPFVVARIGAAAARPLFLSGKPIDAGEARAIGLVDRIVAVEELDRAIEVEVSHFLQASPEAAARAKVLAKSLAPPITDALLESVIGQLADAWETAEAHEGIAAFFEKRNPPWRA